MTRYTIRYGRLFFGGIYKPGDRLQEEALANELGTSRMPVREALRKLEVENFVTYYPHRGTVVSDVSVDEINELYEARVLLETFIVRRAARKASPEDVKNLREILVKEELCRDPDDVLDSVEEFNNALFKISGAQNLVDVNQRIRELLQRVLVNNHLNLERRRRAHQEHMLIVDALEAQDPDLAEKYIKDHLLNSTRKLKV